MPIPLQAFVPDEKKVIEMRQHLVSRAQIVAEQGKGDIKLCSTSFSDAKEKRSAYKTKLKTDSLRNMIEMRYIMHYCKVEMYYALLCPAFQRFATVPQSVVENPLNVIMASHILLLLLWSDCVEDENLNMIW